TGVQTCALPILQECSFRILRVERASTHVTSAGATHHHGAGKKGAIPGRGYVVREHVIRIRDEVNELHLCNGTHSHVRGSCRCPYDCHLGYRGVYHAILAELRLKSVGHLEGAAVLADVLAEKEHVLVAFHLLGECLTNRLEEGNLSHVRLPLQTRFPILPDARAPQQRSAHPCGTTVALPPADPHIRQPGSRLAPAWVTPRQCRWPHR